MATTEAPPPKQQLRGRPRRETLRPARAAWLPQKRALDTRHQVGGWSRPIELSRQNPEVQTELRAGEPRQRLNEHKRSTTSKPRLGGATRLRGEGQPARWVDHWPARPKQPAGPEASRAPQGGAGLRSGRPTTGYRELDSRRAQKTHEERSAAEHATCASPPLARRRVLFAPPYIYNTRGMATSEARGRGSSAGDQPSSPRGGLLPSGTPSTCGCSGGYPPGAEEIYPPTATRGRVGAAALPLVGSERLRTKAVTD